MPWDGDCAHRQRNRARKQSVEGERSPSGSASCTANHRAFEQTNISKGHRTNIPLYPHKRTALHLGSETLSYSRVPPHPEKCNRTSSLVDSLPGLQGNTSSLETSTSSEGQTSRARGMKGLEDFIPYTNDVVCGPPRQLRGPGLHSLSP